MGKSVTAQEIFQAYQRIKPHIRRTPLLHSEALSKATNSSVSLKMESLQITGSFKLRGATNSIAQLTEGERGRGVVGVSTGNHGRGLAYAAKAAGVKSVICMSELVPENKVKSIRDLGADVRIIGRSQDDAQVEVDRLVSEGMIMLPPFDHPHVIAGQGTIGIEILEDMPDVETVLVPLSGGGLISGIAAFLKAANPNIRVIGISMSRGAAMIESLKADKPVLIEELPTLADSLGGGIGLDNQYTFIMSQRFVDEFITVEEHEIAGAIRHTYWQEKQVIEGSGSVGIAALLAGKISNVGKCVSLISGCNIDMALHQRIIDGENVDISKEIKS